MSPLWKNIYLGLLPIFQLGFCLFVLILSSMNSLYILGINFLSIISFTNIFSHSEGCLFVLSMVSFAMQKLLSLIRLPLSIFASISFAVGHKSKKILL